MGINSDIIDPSFPYVWDAKLQKTLEKIPQGLCEELDKVRVLFDADYESVIEFSEKPSSVSSSIFINERPVIYRRNKKSPVVFAKNVELISGTPTSVGGSINYPTPNFKERKVTLKVRTRGIPVLDQFVTNHWTVKFISITAFPK